MQIHLLFAVSISHRYYHQDCNDFSFIIPTDSAQLLKKGRLIPQIREGKLYVFYTTNEANEVLTPLTGKTLRIGLKLLNPFFSNFTDLDFDFNLPSPLFYYRNSMPVDTLNGGQVISLVGQIFRHSLSDTARPVTVVLKDADDQLLQIDRITDENNRSTLTYEIPRFATGTGVYTVEESYPSTTARFVYYADTELLQERIWGVVEIAIAESFYNPSPQVPTPNFMIKFAAKEETLKYYIVVNKSTDGQFTDGDLNNLLLSVTDAGFSQDGRSSIEFTPVSSADFTAEEISSNLLLSNSKTQVMLFKSQTRIARQENARHNIQLKKNGTVLIPHLPQPSANRATSDLVIHLTTR